MRLNQNVVDDLLQRLNRIKDIRMTKARIDSASDIKVAIYEDGRESLLSVTIPTNRRGEMGVGRGRLCKMVCDSIKSYLDYEEWLIEESIVKDMADLTTETG